MVTLDFRILSPVDFSAPESKPVFASWVSRKFFIVCSMCGTPGGSSDLMSYRLESDVFANTIFQYL